VTAAVRLVQRLDGHDRRLLGRWALGDAAGDATRRGWIMITHAGGAIVTIASVLLPLLLAPWPRVITARAALALTISHLIVQAMKRTVHRERPPITPLIPCPDCYSFPSGHATAALAVALSYALAWPALAGVLVGGAVLVGWSRVALGVHYPGDVLMGQVIALGTVLGVTLLG
jgi:undecaprenyl-diphosphatase